MIDIHSHIIAGIDDGSKDIEMTINMLKKAEKSGTTDIIATPHFMRITVLMQTALITKLGIIMGIMPENLMEH